eukprot:1652767-Rhodomonas_salina.1
MGEFGSEPPTTSPGMGGPHTRNPSLFIRTGIPARLVVRTTEQYTVSTATSTSGKQYDEFKPTGTKVPKAFADTSEQRPQVTSYAAIPDSASVKFVQAAQMLFVKGTKFKSASTDLPSTTCPPDGIVKSAMIPSDVKFLHRPPRLHTTANAKYLCPPASS